MAPPTVHTGVVHLLPLPALALLLVVVLRAASRISTVVVTTRGRRRSARTATRGVVSSVLRPFALVARLIPAEVRIMRVHLFCISLLLADRTMPGLSPLPKSRRTLLTVHPSQHLSHTVFSLFLWSASHYPCTCRFGLILHLFYAFFAFSVLNTRCRVPASLGTRHLCCDTQNTLFPPSEQPREAALTHSLR